MSRYKDGRPLISSSHKFEVPEDYAAALAAGIKPEEYDAQSSAKCIRIGVLALKEQARKAIPLVDIDDTCLEWARPGERQWHRRAHGGIDNPVLVKQKGEWGWAALWDSRDIELSDREINDSWHLAAIFRHVGETLPAVEETKTISVEESVVLETRGLVFLVPSGEIKVEVYQDATGGFGYGRTRFGGHTD